MQVNNGFPADQLPVDRWRKSTASNPSGNCVEVAGLPDGTVAIRNSRHPSGPALIYTRSEIAAFLAGAKNSEFDDLGRTAGQPAVLLQKVLRTALRPLVCRCAGRSFPERQVTHRGVTARSGRSALRLGLPALRTKDEYGTGRRHAPCRNARPDGGTHDTRWSAAPFSPGGGCDAGPGRV